MIQKTCQINNYLFFRVYVRNPPFFAGFFHSPIFLKKRVYTSKVNHASRTDFAFRNVVGFAHPERKFSMLKSRIEFLSKRIIVHF